MPKKILKHPMRLFALLVAIALFAAACGNDSSDDTTSAPPDDSSSADDTAGDAADDEMADDEMADDEMADDEMADDEPAVDQVVADFDANGDGSITIGVAAAGPANDGAYYQAVVDAAQTVSDENGFNAPIVVDEIDAADAATALADLAAQVDIVIVGASEIAEPLGDLTEEFSDVFWYCNCGAGFPDTPGLAQSLDDGSEIAYTAGVATALLMESGDSSDVAFIGCCDLGFEKEFFLAFQLGLADTNPDYAVTYVPSGDFPFDFDNVANATEALNNAVADGAGAVVPYLGGAHRPVVEAAAEAGLITMSAGASDVCDASEELDYDIAVRFDGGDYVSAIFPQILSGDVQEGQTKRFLVGVDPEPGAVICDATPEQQAAMDEVYARIANGDFAEAFGAIKGEAYAG
jgi:basic membrane protein A and related proteins